MQIDADNLKVVNDTYGHDAGDKLIKNLTTVINEMSRDSDVLARIGGDEFVVLLPETESEHAAVIGERIRVAIQNSAFDIKGNRVQSTVSIGIASYPADSDNVESLFDMADQAMYRSKKEGRNKLSQYQ